MLQPSERRQSRSSTSTLALRMPLSSKDRAALRGEAHHLTPAVHVGQQGLTPTLRQALDDALRTRELVKLAFMKNADVDVKDAANELSRALDAEVVQVIGRTATLYRHNPELKRREDDAPPWRA